MPSSLKVQLTPQARNDIRDILQYTYDEWGREQRTTRQATLSAAIKQLGKHPKIGQARDDLGAGYRRRVVEPDAIYYRIEGDSVRIVRVLHIRRDAQAQLGDQSAEVG